MTMNHIEYSIKAQSFLNPLEDKWINCLTTLENNFLMLMSATGDTKKFQNANMFENI